MAETQHRIGPAFDAADEYRPEPPPEPEIPSWKDGSLRIGIHTSIAGDMTGALEMAHGLGANALQIFSSSPRMWDRGERRASPRRMHAVSRAPQGTSARAAGDSRQLPDQSGFAESGSAHAVGAGISLRRSCAPWRLGPIFWWFIRAARRAANCLAPILAPTRVAAIADGLEAGGARREARRRCEFCSKIPRGREAALGARFEELKAMLDAARTCRWECASTRRIFCRGLGYSHGRGARSGAAAYRPHVGWPDVCA